MRDTERSNPPGQEKKRFNSLRKILDDNAVKRIVATRARIKRDKRYPENMPLPAML